MKNETPKYLMIGSELKEKILSGEITGTLPSMRELMKQYGVSHLTVLRAFRDLSEAGIIEGKHKSAYCVRNARTPERNLLVCLIRPPKAVNEDDNFAADLAGGIFQAASTQRLNVFLPLQDAGVRFVGVPDSALEELALELCPYRQKICGLILDAGITDEQIAKYILPLAGELPVVIAGRLSKLPVKTLVIPTKAGCCELARVISGKYERYILCEKSMNTDYRTDHCELIAEELKKAGHSPKDIEIIPDIFSSIEGNDDLIATLFSELKKRKKTLIFASSSFAARYISDHLAKKGFLSGKDYSLASFDGKHSAYFRTPKIASVRVSGFELGSRAVELLREGDAVGRTYTIGYRVDTNETLI